MNEDLARQIDELADTAQQCGAGAVYAVLSRLHDCYVTGTASQLAKLLCASSLVGIGSARVNRVPASKIN
jgi:hypothetical protein